MDGLKIKTGTGKKKMLEVKGELDAAYANFNLAYEKFVKCPSIRTHDAVVFAKLFYQQKLEAAKCFICISEGDRAVPRKEKK